MKKVVLIPFVMAFVLPSLVFGQRTTTSISGSVIDPSGAVVAGAQVTATEISTGTTASGKSGGDGFYILTNLRPGTYRLRVEQPGFESYVREGIILEVDRPVSVNVGLQVGSQAQSVTVSGAAPQVDVRTGELNSVITGSMAVDLPLNGRNVLQLMALSPDVSPSRAGGNWIPYAQNAIRPEATSVFMSASGGRGNSTAFYLDGGINEDNYDQVANVYPNPDALQEFSYETNNYSAKYGGRGGGVVNAVTRGGTNQLHGSAFEFLRNGDLNARNFFASKNDGLKRNQYGFSLGGPIQKNKTFFFVDWEGTKLRAQPSQNEATVPTAAEREGDFSAISTQLVNPGTGAPFTNNQVDPSLFNPITAKVLNLLPVGAPGTGVAYYTSQTINNDNQAVARVDHSFGSKYRFSGRYFYDQLNVPIEADTRNVLTATDSTMWRSQNLTLNGEFLLHPNLIATVTATYDRVIINQQGVRGFPSWTQLGVNIRDLQTYTDEADPPTSVGGYFSISGPGLFRYPSAEYQIDNNWTYIRGGHTLQFGADLKLNERTTEDQDYGGIGSFSFTSQVSGDNLLDFMLGVPDNFNQQLYTENTLQRNVPALYATDTWKVGRKLSLTLGVRWNPYVVVHETTGNKLNVFSRAAYDAGVISKRFPLAPPGLLFAGDPGVPSTATPSSYDLFDPRIGFAYDPFGDGKTAIRGGFGIFHDEPYTNGFNGPPFSIPFSLTSSIPFPTSLADPYATPGYTDPFAGTLNLATQPWPEPFSLYAMAPELTDPTIQQWNFTIEHQLTSSLMIRTAYEGSESYHGFLGIEGNPATYIPGQSTFQNVQSRRSMSQFTNVILGKTIGTASYNALAISAEQRLSHGLSLTAGFRWAKSLDEVSGTDFGEDTADPAHINFSRGPSDFNIGKQFILSFLYAIPTARSLGFAGRQILGGWNLNSIVTVRSGFPFTVKSGLANSMIGSWGGYERADMIGDPYLSDSRSRAEKLREWFNPAAFTYNAIGTFGNSPRNFLIGPDFADIDLGLVKSFPIKKGPFADTQRIDVRAEFFNLFNRPNFQQPQAQVSNASTLGMILSANDPRIIQFGLKYVF